MQTFLPYPDFQESARCLDSRRLGKQRVEVLTILRILAGEVRGWQNHPAVLMWKGYENSLVKYGVAICDEWIRRGFADTCKPKIIALKKKGRVKNPEWLGNPEFHRSHQSNLVRKDPVYRQYFDVPDDLPYVWPVTKGKNGGIQK